VWACMALGKCSCMNRAAKVRIAEVGGIVRILSSMDLFQNAADVQLEAASAFYRCRQKIK
jgi:hypothetical protein